MGSQIDAIVAELCRMASARRGGTVIFNIRCRPSDELLLREIEENATHVDEPFTTGRLLDIFDTSKAGHDGAVILRLFNYFGLFAPTISSLANILPTGHAVGVPQLLNRGLRHNSALAMSLLTNSPIVVVSEQTGEITHVRAGQATVNIEGSLLTSEMEGAVRNEVLLHVSLSQTYGVNNILIVGVLHFFGR